MQHNIPIHIYLGGSFDPVHNSHVALLSHVYHTLIGASDAQAADESLNIRASFLPTSRSPFKIKSTVPQHRLNMLRLASNSLNYQTAAELVTKRHSLANMVQFDVSEQELWQTPPTYTIDTLKALREKYAFASIVFILGADSIVDLDKWKEGINLTKFAHLWIMPRDHLQSQDDIIAALPRSLHTQLTANISALKTCTHGHIYIDSYFVPPLSSSQVRAAVANGDFKTAKSALPAEVYSYIIKNNLYRTV